MFTIICSLLLALAPGALAHEGADHTHDHPPVTEAEARDRALAAVVDLVKKGKVDAEWKTREPVLRKQRYGRELQWVATFENLGSRDLTKRRLYVFLTLSGEFIAANHTGR